MFILYLRRRTCKFVLFRVLEGAQCRGAASARECACVCSSCENKRGTSESKEFYCELVVGVATPSDPVGSILVKILKNHLEGGE